MDRPESLIQDDLLLKTFVLTSDNNSEDQIVAKQN